MVNQYGILERTTYRSPHAALTAGGMTQEGLVPMYLDSTPSPIDHAIRIEGDVAYIPLRSRLYPGFIAMVDTNDLGKVGGFKWTVRMTKSGTVTARRGVRKGSKVETVYLHHDIAGVPPKGFVIGHLDGNRLNNTRKNLRHVTVLENFSLPRSQETIGIDEIQKDAIYPYGGVYLIKGADRYKIGISSNPGKRIASLNTASPYPIEIVHIERTPDYKQVESDIHKLFADYRQHGEWFDFDERMLPIVIHAIQSEASR